MSGAYHYRVGGHLPIDAPSYVVRAADREFYAGLKAGHLCYVLNSRQMGKSSLRFRTMHRLQQDGMACVAIDLQGIGSHNITPQQWYAGLVKRLVQGLNLTSQIDLRSWWQERDVLSPVQRFSEFVEVMLPKFVDRQIIIFIDEIDSILSLEFDTDDFFAAIRACSGLPNINFALVGVATPADLIKDGRRSPFNIGQAIELRGFQPMEVQPLIQGLTDKAVRPEVVLEAILYWTGGQPFLTQKLCKLIQDLDTPLPSNYETEFVESLVRAKVITNWEAQDEPEHLKTIRNYLVRSGQQNTYQTLNIYQEILRNSSVNADNSPSQVDLRLSGIVVKKNDQLTISNPIYAQVFDQQWIDRILMGCRPYGEALAAWLESDRQNSSRLLSGPALQAAQQWAKDKALAAHDLDFLAMSHQHEKKIQQKQLLRRTSFGITILLALSTLFLAINFFSQSPKSTQSPPAINGTPSTESPIAVNTVQPPATQSPVAVNTSTSPVTQSSGVVNSSAFQRGQLKDFLNSSATLRANQQYQKSLLMGVRAARQLTEIKDRKPRFRVLVQENLRESLRSLGQPTESPRNGNTSLPFLLRQSCQVLREYLKNDPSLSPSDRQVCNI